MVLRRAGAANPIQQLRSEMDRLFSSVLSAPPIAGAARLMGARPFPAINVWESGENLFAEAEVPGLSSDRLEISVVGNELTIKGERSDDGQSGAAFHRRERGVGPFVRVVRLPVEIEADSVQAQLRDGVLLITLPKAATARPRKIRVNA